MNSLFKVAVIVPTYNLEKIINRTMDSLLSQKGIDDMQIIVVDDGSSDKTLEIVQEYEEKIKNLIIKSFSVPSGGASRPRNAGIELSNSEYITFLDGDDYYGEDSLISAYDHMKQANANIGDLRVVSENRGQIFYPNSLAEYDLDIINDRQVRLMGPRKIYKSSVIKLNNIIFDENVHLDEDRLFNVHAFIHSQNRIIALYDKDYYHLTGGEHEHVTDRRVNQSLHDIYGSVEGALDLVSKEHVGVNAKWLYKFRMVIVDKHSNKWHYKLLNNEHLPYTFRNQIFDEGKRIYNKYLTDEDLSYLKKYFPNWAWLTELIMKHDFSFFNYVNKKMNYLSTAKNYASAYLQNNKLMTTFGDKKGQFMEVNISNLDGIALSIQKFIFNDDNSVLNMDLIAKSRLWSDNLEVGFFLDDNEGGLIPFSDGTKFSQLLLSRKDQVYFVKVQLQKDNYKIIRNVKIEDFASDFQEIFSQMNNCFDGKMKIHFYASGANNLKVRIKEAK